jgi:hypothetical protein
LSSKDAIEQEIHAGRSQPNSLQTSPSCFVRLFVGQRGASSQRKARGYQLVLGYTVGDADPTNTVQNIKDGILKYRQQPAGGPPAVLIFHDTMSITYENLEEIVRAVQAQGYPLMDFDPEQLKNTASLADASPSVDTADTHATDAAPLSSFNPGQRHNQAHSVR